LPLFRAGGAEGLKAFYPDFELFPYSLGMLVCLSETTLEVKLARWEKLLGLLGDITVPREDVSDVEVLANPMGSALRSGMKAGLRLPGLLYIARSIRLDQAWLVRRGVPALAFSVRNHGALKRVIVSTPEAQQLARRLGES
jgi:hypothetical protein